MTPSATPHEITPQQLAHAKGIIDSFSKDFLAKYIRGAREHKTLLWQQPCWKEAVSEVLDLVAYSYVHLQQLSYIADEALAGAADDSVAASRARQACYNILTVLQGVENPPQK
jgi:hypothetical protein